MHVAMIEYCFKPERYEEGRALWKEIVLGGARDRPGMVEFRLLENPPTMVAMGAWHDLSFSREYMATGVFQRFLGRVGELLDGETLPPRSWTLAARQEGSGFGSAYREPPVPRGVESAELASFLVRAKSAVWTSAPMAAVAPAAASEAASGPLELSFEAGRLRFQASYFGQRAVSGQEILFAADRPVWALGAYGRLEPEAEASFEPEAEASFGDFLRSALARPEAEAPYRGPACLIEGKLRYLCASEGSFGRFRGEETIDREGRILYRLSFQGGWID